MTKQTLEFGLIFATCAALGACSTLPSLGDVGQAYKPPQPTPPTVSDVIDHVQCEIWAVLSDDDDPDFDALRKNAYVVYVNLTIDVTVNDGFNPSLNYIHPYATAGTNFTLNANGQLSGQQHRNFNQTFTLDLREDDARANAKKCSVEKESSAGIKGSLGIKEIVIEGLRHSATENFIFPLVDPSDKPAGGLALSLSLSPNFGSTVDFTIVRGIGGGPTWTLLRFSGPASPNTSLINYSKTSKDTLIVSFASGGPRSAKDARLAPGAATPSQQASTAGKSAQDNATRMILQRLLPGP
jgi:hypothetical protein